MRAAPPRCSLIERREADAEGCSGLNFSSGTFETVIARGNDGSLNNCVQKDEVEYKNCRPQKKINYIKLVGCSSN